MDEMATVGYPHSRKADQMSVLVNPGENRRRGAYFMVTDNVQWEKAKKIARFDFRTGQFIAHSFYGRRPWSDFNKKNLADLISFFEKTTSVQIPDNDEDKKVIVSFTMWQYTIYLWNFELNYVSDMDFSFPAGCVDASFLLRDNYQKGRFVPMNTPRPEFILPEKG